MQTFENKVKTDLHRYLLSVNEIDQRLPEAVDIEEKWLSIGEAYLPDGVREFQQYPSASLGWMMYVGMAVAWLWDDDWDTYGRQDNLYTFLRDRCGYDLLDEYIRGPLLGLREPEYSATEALVQECAQRTHAMLLRANLEPGTESAFRGYVACLHQLYLMGAAVQLHRMGYHLQPLM